MHEIYAGPARFQIITDGIIRMEYSDGNGFDDDRTMIAINRDQFYDDAKIIKNDDGSFSAETDHFKLWYDGHSEFSDTTLYALIKKTNKTWHFGDTNDRNMKGTLNTLDNVTGEIELPDGLLSRDGWSLLDDSGTPLLDDTGWAKDRDMKHRCDLYLFAYGHDYRKALNDFAKLSGNVEMPRKYFFGSWYSRWWAYTSDDFKDIVSQYRENGFPLDILVMDMDWHYEDWQYKEGDPKPIFGYGHCGANLGWTGYTWNKRLIPDPDGLLKYMKENNVEVVLNDHPADGVRSNESCYDAFMKELNDSRYVDDVDEVPGRKAAVDGSDQRIVNYRFNAGSKKYMKAFFDVPHNMIEDQGIAFWWVDWQQDYIYPHVHGIERMKHLVWLNYLYYEHSKRNGKRGMGFSRWAGYGDHRHPAYFSGDLTANWETLAFEIKMTISAGNVGCFWWSHDIGGFEDPVPGGQSELFARWVQFGALSPALRLHSSNENGIDRRPWKWGKKYCDSMRKMFIMRSTLLPYIYSSAFISKVHTIPLLRGLYLSDPEDDESYEHPTEYMFGDSLLVSPITEKGKDDNFTVDKKVWLPKGDEWYYWFDGSNRGNGYTDVSCTIDELPLFVKAGSPIVMQPETQRMTKAHLTDLKIIIFAGTKDVSAKETLFEDDGISDSIKTGLYDLTEISFKKSGDHYEVKIEPVHTGYTDTPIRNTITIEINDIPEKCNAEANHPVKSCYNVSDKKMTIMMENVPHDKKLRITIEQCHTH